MIAIIIAAVLSSIVTALVATLIYKARLLYIQNTLHGDWTIRNLASYREGWETGAAYEARLNREGKTTSVNL